MICQRLRRLLTVLTLILLTCLAAGEAVAGQCSVLAQKAQQSAAYYRSSGDAFHQASARNYQNAYNACVASIRQRSGAVTGRTGGGSSAFDVTMGALSVLDSLLHSDDARRRQARAVAREQQRLEGLVRQQEQELQRTIEEARRKAEEDRRQEASRRKAAAALRARCAEENPFGGGKARECGEGASGTPNPFAAPGETTDNPFARTDNAAPVWHAVPTRNPTYDSVNGVDCPDIFENGCIPDGWRQTLREVENYDGDFRRALLDAYDRQEIARLRLYGSSSPIWTEDQYRRLSAGEATFEEIERESFPVVMSTTRAQLEAKLAAIENEPNILRGIEVATGSTIHKFDERK